MKTPPSLFIRVKLNVIRSLFSRARFTQNMDFSFVMLLLYNIGPMAMPRNILFFGDGMFFLPFCSPLVYVLFGSPWLFFIYQYITFNISKNKKNPSL